MSSKMKFKMVYGLGLFAFGLMLNSQTFAHEGHGIPGALPAAPHGGVVAESKEWEEHDHGGHAHDHGKESAGGHQGGKEEKELFFEAQLQDKLVRVFPLTFGANTSTFAALSPAKDLKNVSVKVELPRQKNFQAMVIKTLDDSMEFSFDPKKANRFVVHVVAEFQGKKRVSKIQIERHK